MLVSGSNANLIRSLLAPEYKSDVTIRFSPLKMSVFFMPCCSVPKWPKIRSKDDIDLVALDSFFSFSGTLVQFVNRFGGAINQDTEDMNSGRYSIAEDAHLFILD